MTDTTRDTEIEHIMQRRRRDFSARLGIVVQPHIDGNPFTHAALIIALAQEIGAVIHAAEGDSGQFRPMLEKLARDAVAGMSVVSSVMHMDAKATQPSSDRRQ